MDNKVMKTLVEKIAHWQELAKRATPKLFRNTEEYAEEFQRMGETTRTALPELCDEVERLEHHLDDARNETFFAIREKQELERKLLEAVEVLKECAGELHGMGIDNDLLNRAYALLNKWENK